MVAAVHRDRVPRRGAPFVQRAQAGVQVPQKLAVPAPRRHPPERPRRDGDRVRVRHLAEPVEHEHHQTRTLPPTHHRVQPQVVASQREEIHRPGTRPPPLCLPRGKDIDRMPRPRKGGGVLGSSEVRREQAEPKTGVRFGSLTWQVPRTRRPRVGRVEVRLVVVFVVATSTRTTSPMGVPAWQSPVT